MSGLPPIWLTALRVLTIAGSLLPLGGWAMWLLSQPAVAAHDRLWGRLRQQTGAASGLALVAGVGWLAAVSVQLAGAPPALGTVSAQWSAVLWQTAFGRAWMLRCAGLFSLLMLAVPRRRPRPVLAWLGLAAAALAAASLSLASHAAAASQRWRLFADLAHVLAAALWLGALPLLAAMLYGDGAEPARAQRVIRRFSRMGVVCVAVLAFSGGVNASPLGLSAAVWWGSGYGRMVLVKIALFSAMLGLAAYNRWRLTPCLAGTEARAAMQALRRSIGAELLLGAVILMVVGMLGATMPPHTAG
ncbi:MAG: CopD family protein [Gammaproteobacteria bacterium]|nr:CopD family protein [Gammaproteobacteria bacterium]